MPIYEYKCEKCNKIKEKIHKINENFEIYCSDCKNMKLTKIISGSSFVLKGNGWYKTDYNNKNECNKK